MEKDKKYFENKFKDFESPAPLGAWNKIEADLNQKASRKKAIYFMRIAAGLALLITALWLTLPNLNERKNTIAKTGKNSKVETTQKQNTPDNEQLAAIDSEDQKKLIKPQADQTFEGNSVEENQKSNIKMEVPITEGENLKKPTNNKENTEEPNIKSKGESIENIEPINAEPLLVANESDTARLSESALENELLAENKITTGNEQMDDTGNDSKSITIILRPKLKSEALALNEGNQSEKNTYEKFKESINKDLYKYKVKLGEVPDLALNKLKLGSN